MITAPVDDGDEVLYTQAIRQALSEPKVVAITSGAERYTVKVNHKHSGPEWKIVVDQQRY